MVVDQRPAAAPPVGWLRRRDVQRLEVGWIVVFHVLAIAIMVAGPRAQVYGPSTEAIFGFIPLPAWVAWYGVAAALAAAATHRGTDQRLARLWVVVFPLLLGWIVGFAIGVTEGRGNLLGLLVWSSHLVLWAFLAIRLHQGGTGARWGGS